MWFLSDYLLSTSDWPRAPSSKHQCENCPKAETFAYQILTENDSISIGSPNVISAEESEIFG